VDLTGARVKKSFGTALKFASKEKLKVSVALGVATVAMFFLAAPAVGDFAHALGNQKTYATLHERFLPNGRWFNIPYRSNVETAGSRTDDDTLATGSIIRTK
jgi:hypothetical protein